MPRLNWRPKIWQPRHAPGKEFGSAAQSRRGNARDVVAHAMSI